VQRRKNDATFETFIKAFKSAQKLLRQNIDEAAISS